MWSTTQTWRHRGHQLAAFFDGERKRVHMEHYGHTDDDALRRSVLLDYWPMANTQAKAAIRDGWRRQRAGQAA